MRRFLILSLVLSATVAAHAASYEARSPLHAIALDVVSLGESERRYDLTITDVVSGEVLASPKLIAKVGQAVNGETAAGDLHLFYEISDGPRLALRVEFQRGSDVVDGVEASWTTRPRLGRSTSVDGPLRVGGDVRAPVVMEKVEPSYTEAARKAKVTGIVILEVIVGRDGLVKNAYVLKPLPFGLDQAAVDAVKQWKFKPGTLSGRPVDVIYNLTVAFNLDKPPDSGGR